MIHVVGHTAIDHISRVPHLPEKNCSTHITDRQIYFGGGAANIAAGIAMLGEQVTLHSCIGGDFVGGEYDRLDEPARDPPAVLPGPRGTYSDSVHVHGRSWRPDDLLRMGSIQGVRNLGSPVPPVRAHGHRGSGVQLQGRREERVHVVRSRAGCFLVYKGAARIDHRKYRHSLCQPA